METGYREAMLRPRGGQVLAAAVVAVCLIPLAGAVGSGSVALVVRMVPVVALFGFGAVALFWLPSVRFDPAGVEIRNILRTTCVPWPAIEDVETRWSLVLVTAAGRVHAWAAPSGSAVAAGRATRRTMRALRAGATAVPDPGAGSLAAALVFAQWSEYRDAGLLGAVGGAGVVRRWHARTATALAVLALLSVIALAVP